MTSDILVDGLSDRLDKYIALQLKALESRLVAEFQPKIDALRTDAAALEAATARAAAAEARVKELEGELAKAVERAEAAEAEIQFIDQFNSLLTGTKLTQMEHDGMKQRIASLEEMLRGLGADPSEAK